MINEIHIFSEVAAKAEYSREPALTVFEKDSTRANFIRYQCFA